MDHFYNNYWVGKFDEPSAKATAFLMEEIERR